MIQKYDERIFLGYSTTSKAFRVFNKRTLVVEESIHVGSSSSAGITKEELLSVMKSVTEDLKENTYECQRESFKDMQAFKEEILSLTKSLQLNIDEQYVKLQKIQDDVNMIVSTQASNIINLRSDLYTLKQSLDNVL